MSDDRWFDGFILKIVQQPIGAGSPRAFRLSEEGVHAAEVAVVAQPVLLVEDKADGLCIEEFRGQGAQCVEIDFLNTPHFSRFGGITLSRWL